MSQVVDAARTFFDQLAAARWTMLGIALGLHLARLVCQGVGTQQGLIVYVFRNERVVSTRLVSFSVGMQIALTAVNVCLGVIALAATARTLRWRGLVEPVREKLEQPGPSG